MGSCIGAESSKSALYKSVEVSSPQGSKAILGVDALGRCPGSLDPLSARPVILNPVCHGSRGMARVVGGEELLLVEH